MSGERDHLDLGEGTAHPVRVDHGQSEVGGDGEGDGAVDAACLDAHDRLGTGAARLFDGPECRHKLAAVRDLLDDDAGGAHHGRRDHQRVVRQVVHLHQLDRAPRHQALLRPQLPDVGVTAAPRPEHRRADGDVLELFRADATRHQEDSSEITSPSDLVGGVSGRASRHAARWSGPSW